MSPRLILIPRDATPADRRGVQASEISDRHGDDGPTAELEAESKREVDQMWWWAMGV